MFKVWNKKKKCYEKAIIYADGRICIINGNSRTYINGNDNYVLCFYTGLNDKHGKPIFQGDVLKETYDADGETETDITRVAYLQEAAGFVMVHDDKPTDYTYFDDVDLNDIEVIGNTYEGLL